MGATKFAYVRMTPGVWLNVRSSLNLVQRWHCVHRHLSGAHSIMAFLPIKLNLQLPCSGWLILMSVNDERLSWSCFTYTMVYTTNWTPMMNKTMANYESVVIMVVWMGVLFMDKWYHFLKNYSTCTLCTVFPQLRFIFVVQFLLFKKAFCNLCNQI